MALWLEQPWARHYLFCSQIGLPDASGEKCLPTKTPKATDIGEEGGLFHQALSCKDSNCQQGNLPPQTR